MGVALILSILLVRFLYPFLDRPSPQNRSFLKTAGHAAFGRFLLDRYQLIFCHLDLDSEAV